MSVLTFVNFSTFPRLLVGCYSYGRTRGTLPLGCRGPSSPPPRSSVWHRGLRTCRARTWALPAGPKRCPVYRCSLVLTTRASSSPMLPGPRSLLATRPQLSPCWNRSHLSARYAPYLLTMHSCARRDPGVAYHARGRSRAVRLVSLDVRQLLDVPATAREIQSQNRRK